MGIKEAIMNMALDQFKKELKNPNSDVSKKFNSMLYGDSESGDGGLFGKFTDGSMFDEASSGSGGGGSDIIEDTGTSQKYSDVDTKMSKYKRSIPQMVLDNVLPAAGTVARTAGTGLNAYNSLLGNALIAVSNSMGSNGFDNPFAMATALGLGKNAKGAVQGAILGGTGDIVENIGRDIKMEREKERETELLLHEKPPGQFYDSRKQLTKNIYANSADSSNINKNSSGK